MRRIVAMPWRVLLPCLPALLLCLTLGGLPARAAQPPPGTHQPPAAARLPAQDVYAQAPYTEKELVRFIESMPHFLAWARTHKRQARPVVNAAGKPDFSYTPEAAARAEELGWEARRFFCLLGRTAAAVYLVEESTDLMQSLPPDMPPLTEAEMALARKHLASLLRAGSGG